MASQAWATIGHGGSGYPYVKEAYSGFLAGVVDTTRVVSMTLRETRMVYESLEVFPEDFPRVSP